MWRSPSRPLARLAVVAALLLTAVSAAVLAPVPRADAQVVSEAPGDITWGPGCPSPNPPTYAFPKGWPGWDTHLAWSTAGGDYIGPDADQASGFYEGNCSSGSSGYILDQATETAVFRWHLDLNHVYSYDTFGQSCHLWAYVPSEFAGDRHARYDFWADDQSGHLTWMGWPGHTVDQDTTSGWVDLGGVNVSPGLALTVTLSNKDSVSPGWYAGAGDLSAACQPYRPH
jgi:hypothetical protein